MSTKRNHWKMSKHRQKLVNILFRHNTKHKIIWTVESVKSSLPVETWHNPCLELQPRPVWALQLFSHRMLIEPHQLEVWHSAWMICFMLNIWIILKRHFSLLLGLYSSTSWSLIAACFTYIKYRPTNQNYTKEKSFKFLLFMI